MKIGKEAGRAQSRPPLGTEVDPAALETYLHRACPRPEVAAASRVVIKLGTHVLIDAAGTVADEALREVVAGATASREKGKQVIIVSSGAVGLGRIALELGEDPLDDGLRRVCSAIGQGRLTGLFERCLGEASMVSAQLLLTEEDFSERHRYLELRTTLEELLARSVIPVINENDAVAHGSRPKNGSEGKAPPSRAVFADNDRLAALVAAKCRADLLVLLTDVDGVYDRSPIHHPEARLLDRVDDPQSLVREIDDQQGRSLGRGGMKAKVEAARMATQGGCHVVIASGRRPGTLDRVLAGETEGTFFPALGTLPARRRWIAFAAAPRGALHLDSGAVRALRLQRASLLPVGVASVEGRFSRGDVVELRAPDGEVVGRGVMSYDWEETMRWCAGTSPDPALRQTNCLLRRTDIVLEPWTDDHAD